MRTFLFSLTLVAACASTVFLSGCGGGEDDGPQKCGTPECIEQGLKDIQPPQVNCNTQPRPTACI